MTIKYFIAILPTILLSCRANNEASEFAGSEDAGIQINIDRAADQLSLFGEGVISTALYERDMAIDPEGTEIIYTLGDYKQNIRCLAAVVKTDGKWSKPKVLLISGKYHDIEPFYGVDGKRLYFASNRPIFGDDTRSDYNIWYSDRNAGGWSEPVALDSIINTKADEFFPSVGQSGNLYFTAAREEGAGREDIYISKLEHGKYLRPEALPAEINTEYYEFNAYVSPAEDLIIFSSYGREDGLGGGDLYLSQKGGNGNWQQSKNMGAPINSEKLDYSPFVDWERGNFYFTSERAAEVQPEITRVDSVKQYADNALNGFGNIFKTSLDYLGISK